MILQEKDYTAIYKLSIGMDVYSIYGNILSRLNKQPYLVVVDEFLAAFKYFYKTKKLRIYSAIKFGEEAIRIDSNKFALGYWEDDPEIIVSIIRKWMIEQNVDWNEVWSYQFYLGFPEIIWFKENGEVFDMFEGMDTNPK